MPKTSAAAKEARRTQILNASVRCFARRGYYETTIEDLVAETGLSRGALYFYYPSKEAIYLAISERWSCGLEAAIRAQLAPDLSPAAILQVLIQVNGEHVQAETDACRILMEGWNLAYHMGISARGWKDLAEDRPSTYRYMIRRRAAQWHIEWRHCVS